MTVSRRTFLIGGASALALAACGGGDDDDPVAATTTTTAGGLSVVRIFDPRQPSARPLRLPLTLADREGAILDAVPERISVRWGIEGSTEMSDPLDLQRHAEGVPRPYYPFVVTFPENETYRIEVEALGTTAATTVQVVDPTAVPAVPGPGDNIIPFKTPTTGEPRGIDPICTREPPCPFHELTLEEAIEEGNPVAFLISTPAFCQTAVCGPVLELLIERAEELAPQLTIVHAEVYTDETARTTTDVVQAYGLTWEPSLFLAVPDGTIAARLDYVFDGTELDSALSYLVQ